MSAWDPFELLALPLSAYSPGQPVILPGHTKSVEGKFETASGAPVYTFEDWQRGNAPYVTGATNRQNPSGQLVYRNIGGQSVPVRITDYGPSVEGIDIATSNRAWASKFPYQGATDKFTPPRLAGERDDLTRDLEGTFWGGGQAPAPAPTPTPTPPVSTPRLAAADGRPAPIDLGVLADFAVRNYAPQTSEPSYGPAGVQPPTVAASGGAPTGTFNFLNDYFNAQNATQGAAGALGGILSAFGRSLSQQGNQGTQQAMAMLQLRPAAAGLLAQFANNPWMFLT